MILPPGMLESQPRLQ